MFVCGTGGMGGAALMGLARAGVGRLIVADIDVFEISNLNRQLFAFTDTAGRPKAEAAAEAVRRINPELEIEVLGPEWPDAIERIAQRAQVLVNGTDDLAASLLIYRTARVARLAGDRRLRVAAALGLRHPRRRRRCRKSGSAIRRSARPGTQLRKQDREAAFQCEVMHVLVHSSSRNHIDLAVAAEVAAGRRSRMSFAPMVISTGMLMAYETIALLLDKKTGTDNRGWFLNPYKPAVERPRPAIVAALLRPLVRRFLDRMMNAA